jgi:hypothetical protein
VVDLDYNLRLTYSTHNRIICASYYMFVLCENYKLNILYLTTFTAIRISVMSSPVYSPLSDTAWALQEESDPEEVPSQSPPKGKSIAKYAPEVGPHVPSYPSKAFRANGKGPLFKVTARKRTISARRIKIKDTQPRKTKQTSKRMEMTLDPDLISDAESKYKPQTANPSSPTSSAESRIGPEQTGSCSWSV